MGKLIQLHAKKDKRIIKVIKNKKGSWTVYFSVNKKRMQKTFASKESAEKFVDEFSDLVKGKRRILTNEGTEIELGACVFEMLEYQLENEIISTSSYSSYWDQYISYFDDSYKKIKLHHIDNDFIDRLRKDLRYNKSSTKKSNGARFKSAIILLKKVQKYADSMSYKNISYDLKSLKTPTNKKESKTYTIEDYNKLKKTYLSFDIKKKIELRKKRFAGILLLNMQLGLRSGELRALRFEDIDFKKKRVLINKTVTKTKGGCKIIGDTTKTGNNREIPVTDFGVEILNFLYDFEGYCHSSSNDVSGKSFVLGLSNFEPVSSNTLRYYLKTAAKDAGIPYLPSHSACRKTMATLIATNLQGKVDPFTLAKQVQEILGHSNISTTLNSYIVPASMDTKDLFSVFDEKEEKISS